MAFGATCDVCRADLLGLEIRYTLTLELAQAYDPMEVTSKDLRRDLRGQLEALVHSMEQLPAAEVQRCEDEIYSSFRFDICPACAAKLREDAKQFLYICRAPERKPRSAERGGP
jgi:hypothetical protein